MSQNRPTSEGELYQSVCMIYDWCFVYDAQLPKPEGEWPFEVNSKDTTGNYPAAQTNDTK